MTDDRIKELATQVFGDLSPEVSLTGNAARFARAIEAECLVPDGWVPVPVEPSDSQLDVAVSFALNVNLSGEYNWSAYMRDVYARMLAAAPKPEPERKHETVPTLAEPSEYAKAFQDMITHGYSFMKDGMRIPPEDVIEPAEPDCECGAVASEHCPACEPVAQEPFGIWHQGDTEEESDFFLFKDSGDVSCPNCIKLYTAPPDQSAEVSMTPAASIFKDEVARLNAEVERLRDHGKKLQSLVDAGLDLCERKDKRIAELEATIEAQRTLYANCIKISHEADELEHKCNRLERQQAVLVEALEAVMHGSRYCRIMGEFDWHEIAMPSREALGKARAALASVNGNA